LCYLNSDLAIVLLEPENVFLRLNFFHKIGSWTLENRIYLREKTFQWRRFFSSVINLGVLWCFLRVKIKSEKVSAFPSKRERERGCWDWWTDCEKLAALRTRVFTLFLSNTHTHTFSLSLTLTLSHTTSKWKQECFSIV
jgi:hypothetical protein